MQQSERIVSVDFLRGLTVAMMILVNNPGSWEFIYPPFQHASWNGCTPTDLVFPFFLFIVGISIAYSLSTAKAQSNRPNSIYFKILKRAALLFLIGFILNINFPIVLESIRIPGVLQRISIVFLVSAILYLNASVRTIAYTIAGILITYFILMVLLPLPNGPSSLTPTGNLSAWLDEKLLGTHVWSHTKVWDPEGILSTLPAISSGLIGVLTGVWLKSDREKKDKLLYLFIAANVLLLAGLLVSLAMPINKSIWTSSFVLYTSGIALNCLGITYWCMDIQLYRRFTKPFMAFGSNAIVAYASAEVLAKILYTVQIGEGESAIALKNYLFQQFLVSWVNPESISLVLALWMVVLIWIPIQLMYNRKIFIKV